MRENAAEALGTSGDARAVVPLLAAAFHDSERSVQTKAGRAIVEIGTPAVIPLILLLKDSEARIRKFAAERLGEIGDPRAVEALIPLSHDPDEQIRYIVITALGKIHPQPVMELCDMLQDQSRRTRCEVARVLGEIGSFDAVEALIAALRERDWWVRACVVRALGKIGDPRAIDPLQRYLRGWHVPFWLQWNSDELWFLRTVESALNNLGIEASIPWWWAPLL